jgi:hypothetical protein
LGFGVGLGARGHLARVRGRVKMRVRGRVGG